jgi:transcription elongation factor GreA
MSGSQSAYSSAAKVVRPGCSVTLTGFEPDEMETYCLVPDEEVDLMESKISVNSELAQTLLGTRVGEQVPYNTPNGPVKLTVVDVNL